MNERWALYIDIEGFGAKWNDTTMDAFKGINTLMQGIFWIGDRYYRDPPERLFAHQFGDGFLVTSDFHEESLDRAILVAIALLRHLLAIGEVAKCSIVEGMASDVKNCYPPEVRNQLSKGNVHLGRGVMTVSPVLGSALINAVSLQKRSPSGPLLTLSQENMHRVTCRAKILEASTKLVVVNWLFEEPFGLSELQVAAGLNRPSQQERSVQLSRYIESNPYLKPEWKANAQKYLLDNGV